ncbi:MAG TPA: CoA pyrophosphatase, partial [Vicinamibacteria bacterium]
MEPTWTDVQTALAARAPAQVADPPSSRAAVALILRDGPQGIEVLFIRRAEHPKDPWSGQMAFPGGRAEPGDADLRATAIRETREEIGVDLGAAAEPLGGLDEVRAMARLRPMNLTIT